MKVRANASLIRLGVAALSSFMLMLISLDAATAYNWKGGSGKWSDPNCWNVENSYPSTNSDKVTIPVNGETIEIEIDKDVSVASLGFTKTVQSDTGAPLVKFVGNGSIKVSGNAAVNDFRSFVLDGPSLEIGGTFYVRGNVELKSGGSKCSKIEVGVQGGSYGALTINGGELSGANSFSIASGTSLSVREGKLGSECKIELSGTAGISGGDVDIYGVVVKAGGNLSVTGGDVVVGEHELNDNSLFNVAGGKYSITSKETTSPLANVSVTGGAIIAEGIKWNNSRYFGGEESSFISTLNSAYAMNLFSEDGQVVDIQGSVYATNRNDDGVLGGLNIPTFGNLSINGRGALHLGQLIYAPDDSFAPLMIDLSELSLANKLSIGGDVYLCNNIKLGAFGDWSRVGSYSLYLCGALECDTTDTFDRSTPRSISLGKVTPYTQEASVTVLGGGSVDMELANPKSRLSSISVDDGATLTMRRGFAAASLHLGENATMNVSSSARIEVSEATVSSGAKLCYEVSGTEGLYPVISCNSESSADAISKAIQFIGDSADGTSLVRFGNHIASIKGELAVTHPDNEWIGAVDGEWANAGNWSGNSVPARTSNIYFGGTNNTAVTYGDSLKYEKIEFLPTCSPYVLSGGEFKLDSNSTKEGSALISYSRFPVKISSKLHHAGTTFGIYSSGGSYVELAGKCSGGKRVVIGGDVRVSGSLESGWLEWESASASEILSTRLTVLEGGIVSFTNQCKNLSRSATLSVKAGGLLSMNGSNRWTTVRNMHSVNGRLELGGVSSMTASQMFCGTGNVFVDRAKADTDGTAEFHIGNGLKLAPKVWETASGDSGTNTLALVVETDATLTATSDWTYGPAVDATDETDASNRALKIWSSAKLTVDTGDASDSSIGHVVTIADPIVGGRNASVVKKGKGTLVLAAPDNVIPGGVTIEEGALGWSCDGLSLTSLDFRDGAKLAPPLRTTGEFAMLTVSNNVDITGVSFAAFDATADESLRNNPAIWLAVPEGCRITGVPNSRGWSCRVTEFNGGEALEVQYLGGFAISIR